MTQTDPKNPRQDQPEKRRDEQESPGGGQKRPERDPMRDRPGREGREQPGREQPGREQPGREQPGRRGGMGGGQDDTDR